MEPQDDTAPDRLWLLDLSDELLLEIFRWLDIDALYSLGFVCQHSRKLCKDRSLSLKESMMDVALQSVDRQDYDSALTYLSTMKRLFPFWGEVWKERGLCWKDKGYIKRSLKALRIARQLTSDWGTKLGVTAQIRWIQDKPQAAFKLIDMSCKNNPTNPKLFHFRAFIQSCLSHAGDAKSLQLELADYKTVLNIHRNVAPYKRLAIVHNSIRSSAQRCFVCSRRHLKNRSLNLGPLFLPCITDMGFVYFEKENLEKALEHYNTSLQLCPHHVRAFYNRSLVRQEWGQFVKAIADIDQILALNPKLTEVYSLRGWSNISRGRYSAAADDYRSSLPRTSTMDHVVSAYLHILICIGRIDEALEYSHKLLEENKESLEKYELLQSARDARIAAGKPLAGDIEEVSDDEDWMNQAAEHFARDPESTQADLSSSSSSADVVQMIDLNDELNDFDVTDKKYSDIKKTVAMLRRMRGELYIIDGKWLLARQMHTEQLKLNSLEPLIQENGYNTFLELMFSNKNAPQVDLISASAIDLTSKMVRACKSTSIRSYLMWMLSDPEMQKYKFKNVEESLYYISAYAYKYLALYLPPSAQTTVVAQLLASFWLAVRQLPPDTVASQGILSPFLIIQCLKLFKRSNGTANLLMVFAIVPGLSSKGAAAAHPWVEFVQKVSNFILERIQSLNEEVGIDDSDDDGPDGEVVDEDDDDDEDDSDEDDDEEDHEDNEEDVEDIGHETEDHVD